MEHKGEDSVNYLTRGFQLMGSDPKVDRQDCLSGSWQNTRQQQHWRALPASLHDLRRSWGLQKWGWVEIKTPPSILTDLQLCHLGGRGLEADGLVAAPLRVGGPDQQVHPVVGVEAAVARVEGEGKEGTY